MMTQKCKQYTKYREMFDFLCVHFNWLYYTHFAVECIIHVSGPNCASLTHS